MYKDILRLLGEKAKATSDLMVRLLGVDMTQLGRGCIEGSLQVFLTRNQGSVKQLGLPVSTIEAEMGKDKPGQRPLGEAEGQKTKAPSTNGHYQG